MPVLRDGRIIDDIWRRLADDERLPEAGAILVGLARFKSERAAIEMRAAPTALALKSHERAHEIGEDANLFDLIEVELPKFRDGRAFSATRLLRERYDYRGTLRATGHILPDQALFLARCGVDEIVLGDISRLDAFRHAESEFSVVFQPTGTRLPTLRRRAPIRVFAQAAE